MIWPAPGPRRSGPRSGWRRPRTRWPRPRSGPRTSRTPPRWSGAASSTRPPRRRWGSPAAAAGNSRRNSTRPRWCGRTVRRLSGGGGRGDAHAPQRAPGPLRGRDPGEPHAGERLLGMLPVIWAGLKGGEWTTPVTKRLSRAAAWARTPLPPRAARHDGPGAARAGPGLPRGAGGHARRGRRLQAGEHPADHGPDDRDLGGRDAAGRAGAAAGGRAMTAGRKRRPARAAGRGGRPTLVDPNVAMRGSAARRAAAGEPPPEP